MLTFAAMIRMSLLSNTSLSFREHLKWLLVHIAMEHTFAGVHTHTHIEAFLFEQHRSLKLDVFWTFTSVLPCFSAKCHSLVSHVNGNKAKLLTLHVIVDPKG